MRSALVLCEESGIWSEQLSAAGFDVIQCDLALPAGRRVRSEHWTQFGGDAREFSGEKFDVVAAFPPCTDLSGAGAYLWHKKDVYAAMELATACASIAAAAACGLVENPQGLLRRVLGQPSMTVHPWQFADDPAELKMKRTCLWLFGWPPPFFTWTYSRSEEFVTKLGWNSKGSKGAAWVEKRRRLRSQSWRGMASAFVRSLAF